MEMRFESINHNLMRTTIGEVTSRVSDYCKTNLDSFDDELVESIFTFDKSLESESDSLQIASIFGGLDLVNIRELMVDVICSIIHQLGKLNEMKICMCVRYQDNEIVGYSYALLIKVDNKSERMLLKLLYPNLNKEEYVC